MRISLFIGLSVMLVSMLVGVSLGLAAAWFGGGGKFPSKPIEYVVQASPGGGSDTFVRVVADILAKEKIITVPIAVAMNT